VWIDIVSASDALARAKELEQAYEGEEKPRLFTASTTWDGVVAPLAYDSRRAGIVKSPSQVILV
jgi:hypothetical protein